MKKFLLSILIIYKLIFIAFFINFIFLTVSTYAQTYTYYCGSDAIFSDNAQIGECDIYHDFGCNKNAKWLGAYNGSTDGSATFTINMPQGGNYNIIVGYTHGFSDGAHTMKITVNGTDYTKSLTNTGGWCVEATFSINIALNAGSNTIIFHGNGNNTQSPDLMYFGIPQPAGVHENSIDNNICIYSDKNQIIVENKSASDKGTIKIFDILGKIISSFVLESNSINKLNVQDINQSQQIYFVQVIVNDQSITKKICFIK